MHNPSYTVNLDFPVKRKRGRPAKVKSNISDFSKAIEDWDKLEEQVDWQEIAHKQEGRLTAYIAENEELANICISRWEEIQHLKYLVKYLEGKHEDSSV